MAGRQPLRGRSRRATRGKGKEKNLAAGGKKRAKNTAFGSQCTEQLPPRRYAHSEIDGGFGTTPVDDPDARDQAEEQF
jgi:hypothetical protein